MCYGAPRPFYPFKRTESNQHEKPCRKVVITVKIGAPVIRTDTAQIRDSGKHIGLVSSDISQLYHRINILFLFDELPFKTTTEEMRTLEMT